MVHWSISLKVWKGSEFVNKHQNFVHRIFDILFDAVENETSLAFALENYIPYKNTNADLEGIEHTECIDHVAVFI